MGLAAATSVATQQKQQRKTAKIAHVNCHANCSCYCCCGLAIRSLIINTIICYILLCFLGCKFYTLDSINLARKYLSVFDLLCTCLMSTHWYVIIKHTYIQFYIIAFVSFKVRSQLEGGICGTKCHVGASITNEMVPLAVHLYLALYVHQFYTRD